jgi:bacterioferritin
MASRSHSEYPGGETLRDLLKEDLVAGSIAVETYSEIIRWLAEDHPTARRMMEEILETEEEHANDLL